MSKKNTDQQDIRHLMSHKCLWYKFRSPGSESQYNYFFYNESLNMQQAVSYFAMLICVVSITIEILLLKNTSLIFNRSIVTPNELKDVSLDVPPD
jgi:hypothetical protein